MNFEKLTTQQLSRLQEALRREEMRRQSIPTPVVTEEKKILPPIPKKPVPKPPQKKALPKPPVKPLPKPPQKKALPKPPVKPLPKPPQKPIPPKEPITLKKYTLKNLRDLAKKYNIATFDKKTRRHISKQALLKKLVDSKIISNTVAKAITANKAAIVKSLQNLQYKEVNTKVKIKKLTKDELISLISKTKPEALKKIMSAIKILSNPKYMAILRKDRNKMIQFLNTMAENLSIFRKALGRRLIIKINTDPIQYYAVTRKYLTELAFYLTEPDRLEEDDFLYGSDRWIDDVVIRGIDYLPLIEFVIEDFEDAPNQDGGFFDKINISPFDLSKLGIINKFIYDENKKVFVSKDDNLLKSELTKLVNEHCIIDTLRVLGISEELLNIVKYRLNANLQKSKLKEVSEIINKQIRLHHYSFKNMKTKIYCYGNKNYDVIDIALYNHHYFPFIDLPIEEFIAKEWRTYFDLTNDTTYLEFIHYFNLKHLDNEFKNIFRLEGNYYKKRKDSKINSLSLVRVLEESGSFISHPIFNDFFEFRKTKVVDNPLDYIDVDIKKFDVSNKSKNINKNKHFFYADFETITTDFIDNSTSNIKAFMLGYSDVNDNCKIFTDTDCNYEMILNSMLNDIVTKPNIQKEDRIIIYFHNMKFDKLFFSDLTIIDKCKKSGNYYSIKAIFKGFKIEFRDSYKLIPEPLSNFGGMFGINCCKQTIPYKLYNQNTIKLNTVMFKDAIQKLEKQLITESKVKRENIINEFKSSAEKFIDGDSFRHMDYMKYYLKMDCITLGQGLRVFNDKIKNITNLNAYDYLTISSLMFAYCVNKGVFSNQYQVTGFIRDWLSKAVYGGRVTSAYGKKWYVKTNKKSKSLFIKKTSKKLGLSFYETKSLIADFDAVSLYPSAIYRICEEIGIPCGKPLKLTEDEISLLNNPDNLDKIAYYVVDVKITKVNKIQQIPFICYKNKEGGSVYTNDPPKDTIFTIDKITLQDWVKFHKIEYEIVKNGIKWTEFNKKFGEVIEELFLKRLECKANMKKSNIYSNEEISGFNALQQIYKLMLNSAYGKTIMKASTDKYKYIVKGKDNNEDFEKKIKTFLVKNHNRIKSIKRYNNYAEVKMIESFKANYNFAHIGINILSMSKRIMNEVQDIIMDLNYPCLYQDTDSLHILNDSLPDIANEYRKRYNKELIGANLGQLHTDFELSGAQNVLSKELIILGKKCYIDVLEGVNKNNGEIVEGEHCRMKGINKAALAYQRDLMKVEHNLPIYQKLYEGKELSFDLTYGEKFSVQYIGEHGAFQRQQFMRTLVF